MESGDEVLSLETVIIVACVCGCIVFVLTVVLIVLCCRRRHTKCQSLHITLSVCLSVCLSVRVLYTMHLGFYCVCARTGARHFLGPLNNLEVVLS